MPRQFVKPGDTSGRMLRMIGEAIWLPAIFALVATLIVSIFYARSKASTPVGVPTLSGAVIGPKQVVFDTQNGCEQIDIPDAPARAFRDDHEIVHLLATHYVARAMLGPNLNELKRDCRVIYRSLRDPDPAHFQDNNWLYSFYTEDGRRIAALVHSEYDADEFPGMCALYCP